MTLKSKSHLYRMTVVNTYTNVVFVDWSELFKINVFVFDMKPVKKLTVSYNMLYHIHDSYTFIYIKIISYNKCFCACLLVNVQGLLTILKN